MGRAPCCDKANVKRGPWSPEEDAKLKGYIEENGTGGNWIALPQKIGLKRCGKSCRLRWLNYLRPNIKHGGFSEEEDNIICSLYINIGSRWSIIAAQLPGRTDNDIKNYWNTRLKKKLFGKHRKDQQARRASCLSLEQEMKREINEEDYMMTQAQAPYWTQIMPLTTTNHDDPPLSSTMISSGYPLDVSFVEDDIYVNSMLPSASNSILQVTSSSSKTHFNAIEAAVPSDMFQGLDDFPGEQNNQHIFDGFPGELNNQHIFDGFYGNTSTTESNSSTWGDVYSQIVSGFEASQQSMPQVSTYANQHHCTWAV